MGIETYIILRVPGATARSGDPLTDPVWREAAPFPAAAAPREYRVEIERVDERQLADLRRDPEVQRGAAAPAFPVTLVAPVAMPAADSATQPADGATWGVAVTGALQSPYTGYGITVAVLDSGIDAGHEAFAGIELVQKDFTGEGNGDTHGHGTHVAGIIFGQTRQEVRYSVAPGVRRALIGKVLGGTAANTTKAIVEGIKWAQAEGAQVINLSLEIDFPGWVQTCVQQYHLPVDLATARALKDYRETVRLFDRLVALIEANAPTPLLVAAAGNASRRDMSPDHRVPVAPPAAADGILSVGALQTSGAPHTSLAVWPRSNSEPSVAAPGVGIYSAKAGGGYQALSGTSMASPHVAGVAALWAEKQRRENGVVDTRLLHAKLLALAAKTRLGNPVDPVDVGAGLVCAPGAG
jgi:subtilisin family serine protease